MTVGIVCQNAVNKMDTIMDADMQDPPALLPEMLEALKEEGFDSVATRRRTRDGEPLIRSFFARTFYKLINKISKTEIVDGARDFRMMNRKFVDALLMLSEYNRFSKGLFGWVGMKTKWIAYDNIERTAGKTKWSFWKLMIYAMEGFIAFSTAPLSVASVIGFLFCIVATIWIVVIVIKTLVLGDPVAGFPTTACLILLVGGSLQLSLGILGQYLAKTYLESKHRPVYLIAESNLAKDRSK